MEDNIKIRDAVTDKTIISFEDVENIREASKAYDEDDEIGEGFDHISLPDDDIVKIRDAVTDKTIVSFNDIERIRKATNAIPDEEEGEGFDHITSSESDILKIRDAVTDKTIVSMDDVKKIREVAQLLPVTSFEDDDEEEDDVNWESLINQEPAKQNTFIADTAYFNEFYDELNAHSVEDSPADLDFENEFDEFMSSMDFGEVPFEKERAPRSLDDTIVDPNFGRRVAKEAKSVKETPQRSTSSSSRQPVKKTKQNSQRTQAQYKKAAYPYNYYEDYHYNYEDDYYEDETDNYNNYDYYPDNYSSRNSRKRNDDRDYRYEERRRSENVRRRYEEEDYYKKKKHPFIRFLVTLFVIALCVGGFWGAKELFNDVPINKYDNTKITYTVVSGLSDETLADELIKLGLINNKYLFKARCILYDADYVEGTYELSPSFTTEKIINILSGYKYEN